MESSDALELRLAFHLLVLLLLLIAAMVATTALLPGRAGINDGRVILVIGGGGLVGGLALCACRRAGAAPRRAPHRALRPPPGRADEQAAPSGICSATPRSRSSRRMRRAECRSLVGRQFTAAAVEVLAAALRAGPAGAAAEPEPGRVRGA